MRTGRFTIVNRTLDAQLKWGLWPWARETACTVEETVRMYTRRHSETEGYVASPPPGCRPCSGPLRSGQLEPGQNPGPEPAVLWCQPSSLSTGTGQNVLIPLLVQQQGRFRGIIPMMHCNEKIDRNMQNKHVPTIQLLNWSVNIACWITAWRWLVSPGPCGGSPDLKQCQECWSGISEPDAWPQTGDWTPPQGNGSRTWGSGFNSRYNTPQQPQP